MNFENFRNSEVRAYARERLKGNWLKGMVIALIICLIGGGVSVVTTVAFVKWPYAASIFVSLFELAVMIALMPLTVSTAYVFLSFSRGDMLELEGLTYGYKKGLFGKSIVLTIVTNIFIFLWTLLFIIPGIIKALSYSLAPYVLVDNPTFEWRECLNASKKLTDGYKGQIFLLGLSFIGWGILCLFTLGIGYFFLYPYIQTSMANFYDRRRISVYGVPEYKQEEEPIVRW